MQEAPVLPAPILASWCYSNIFTRCTSLNKVTILAEDTSAGSWGLNWLDANTSANPHIIYCKDADVIIDNVPYGWEVVEI
jgi:hypothetical protein